jgi:hypothetical protein
VRPREAVVPQAAAVAHADDDEEGSGTVMFSTAEMNLSTYGQTAPKAAPGKDRPRAVPSPAGNLDALDPETRKKHEEAQRFARLLVSEIKLYNEAKVKQGQKTKDLYDLRDDIERSGSINGEHPSQHELLQRRAVRSRRRRRRRWGPGSPT